MSTTLPRIACGLAALAATAIAGCAPAPRAERETPAVPGFELFEGPVRQGDTVFYHEKPSRAGAPLATNLEASHPGALLWVFAFTETGSSTFSRRVDIAQGVASADADCAPVPVADTEIAGQGNQPRGVTRYVMLPVMCRF